MNFGVRCAVIGDRRCVSVSGGDFSQQGADEGYGVVTTLRTLRESERRENGWRRRKWLDTLRSSENL